MRHYILPGFGLTLVFLILGLHLYDGANAGSELPEKNSRAKLIRMKVDEFSLKKNMLRPTDIRVVQQTAVAAAHRVGVIHIHPSLLEDKSYTDMETTAIIAHEMGHIVRRDGWRLWNHFFNSWLIEKELAADAIGAELAGEEAMCSLFKNHRDQVIAGSLNKSDPHPTLEARMNAVGGCSKRAIPSNSLSIPSTTSENRLPIPSSTQVAQEN